MRLAQVREQSGWLLDVTADLDQIAKRVARRQKRYPKLAATVKEAKSLAQTLFCEWVFSKGNR